MYRTDFSLADLPATLRPLYLHWKARAHHGPPQLDRFDLTRIPGGLDHVILTEILRDEDGTVRDFEAAFLGPDVRRHVDRASAGQPLTRLAERGPGTELWTIYSRFAAEGLPAIASVSVTGVEGAIERTEELFLPLAGKDHAVQYALVGVLFHPARAASGGLPVAPSA